MRFMRLLKLRQRKNYIQLRKKLPMLEAPIYDKDGKYYSELDIRASGNRVWEVNQVLVRKTPEKI